jgi:excisionase family DNA binding protein
MVHNKDGTGLLPARYFTPADVAELLGVPLDTVYQWRYKRTGPPGFRVGRHLRYDPRAVSRWIAELADGAA